MSINKDFAIDVSGACRGRYAAIFFALFFGCFFIFGNGVAEDLSADSNAQAKVFSGGRPFDNMIRKFVLLAQDVASSTQQNAADNSGAGLQNNPPASSGASANSSANVSAQSSQGSSTQSVYPASPPGMVVIPPMLSTTTVTPAPSQKTPPAQSQPAAIAQPVAAPASPASANEYPLSSITSPAPVKTKPSVEPLSGMDDMQIPDPKVDGKTFNILPNAEKGEGFIQKLLKVENAKNKTNSGAKSAVPYSDIIPQTKYKKPFAIKNKPAEKENSKDIIKKSSEPAPAERPENYKTQRLPDSISKKSYTKDNKHLPLAFYNEEYKKILFDSAASGKLDVLRAMVENFGDTEVPNEEGDTPLIYAVMAGSLQSAMTLTSLGANVNAQNFNGVSPLYAATKLGRIDMVKLLIAHSADIELADKNDRTPLMLASEMDFSTIAGIFIKQGANIDKKMRNGNTALHFAALKNSLASMNLLITKDADMEIRNFKGYTPLMLATEAGQDQAVALLLKAGADMHKTNVQGMDLEAIADKQGYGSIVEAIQIEKTRQLALEKELIQKKQKEIMMGSIESPFKKPLEEVAKRVGGVPLPIIKPSIKAPLEVPKPSFSIEEMQKMQQPE